MDDLRAGLVAAGRAVSEAQQEAEAVAAAEAAEADAAARREQEQMQAEARALTPWGRLVWRASQRGPAMAPPRRARPARAPARRRPG